MSFIIFAYNQEDYIHETILSALSQIFSPMEIIISDDSSTDRTYEIIKETVSDYHGEHLIILNRNNHNIGLGAHFNKVVQMANGQFLIISGGDDISIPKRTQILYDEWISSNKRVKSVFSNVTLIDGEGNAHGTMFNNPPRYTKDLNNFINKPQNKTLTSSQPRSWVLGCSQAFDKSLFDIYGPFDESIVQEDGVLSFRALLQGEIKYIDSVLVKYRRHGKNAFQPNSINSVLRLLKKEYYYKRQWLKDALITNSENKKLIRLLKQITIKSYFFHLLYHIPLINYMLLFLKNKIKQIVLFFFR